MMKIGVQMKMKMINPDCQVCEEGKIKVKSKALIKKIQSSDIGKKYLFIS